MTRYDKALEDNDVRRTSLMMAVPYSMAFEEFVEIASEDGELNQEKLLNLTLDRAIENIKSNNEFKFVGLKESSDSQRLIEVEYKGTIYPVFLFFEAFDKRNFWPKTALIDLESKEIDNSPIGIVTETMFTEDFEKSYMFQLKLVNSLFDITLVLADMSSNALFSGKWLYEVCKMSAMPSPTFLFTIHNVASESGERWQHTHGLRRCNLFELEILNVTEETSSKCANLLSYLGLFLLTSEKPKELEPTVVGRGIVIALQNYEDAIKKYGDIMGCTESDRVGHDEFYMAVFVYLRDDDEEKKVLNEVSPLLNTMDNPIFYVRNSESVRMAKSARVFFNGFLKLAEIEGTYPIIKGGIIVDEEHQNDEDEIKREHLWFDFLEYDEELKTIKGILQNQPYYIKALNAGDVVVFNFDEITDWIVYQKENIFTPNNVYLIN